MRESMGVRGFEFVVCWIGGWAGQIDRGVEV